MNDLKGQAIGNVFDFRNAKDRLGPNRHTK